MSSYQIRDDEITQLPHLVVTESTELFDKLNQAVLIRRGATLTAHGKVNGTVEVEPGAAFDALGDVNGDVHIPADARATFQRKMSGTLVVDRGGEATMATSAAALGTLHVEGSLLNYGTRAAQVHGNGFVDDRAGSTVRHPDLVTNDGTEIYYAI